MNDKEKIDGRSLRQQGIYNEAHTDLIYSAIELLQNPEIDQKKINVSMIGKNAGTSVATCLLYTSPSPRDRG